MKRKCESHGDVKAKKLTNCAEQQSGKQGEGANRQVGRRGLEVNVKHNTCTHTETTTELIQL